jgi:hypothetical protein
VVRDPLRSWELRSFALTCDLVDSVSPPPVWKRLLAEGADPELLLIGNAATAIGTGAALLLWVDTSGAVAGGAAVSVFLGLWLCLAFRRTAWLPRAIAFLTYCVMAAFFGAAVGYWALGRVGAWAGGVVMLGLMVWLAAAVRARDSANA